MNTEASYLRNDEILYKVILFKEIRIILLYWRIFFFLLIVYVNVFATILIFIFLLINIYNLFKNEN